MKTAPALKAPADPMDMLGIVGGALQPPSGKGSDKKKVNEKKKAGALGFKNRLKEKESLELNASEGLRDGLSGLETAEDLLDDVYQLGEELKHDGTMETLKKYRSAVKTFYKYVVTKSLEATQNEGRLNPKTKSRKQYTTIAVIDEKLEKLGAAVLRSQKEQLEILRKIDEIHGILIDLTS